MFTLIKLDIMTGRNSIEREREKERERKGMKKGRRWERTYNTWKSKGRMDRI